MATLDIHRLREHPPLEPTVVQFVFEGQPSGYPWSSGDGGAVFFRTGIKRGYSWGELIDQHIDWADDPDLDDTLPDGWVRLIPETKD